VPARRDLAAATEFTGAVLFLQLGWDRPTAG
jgi:hypothetical protein